VVSSASHGVIKYAAGDVFLSDDDDPHSLLILAEEELVAIDLVSAGWPCYELPYLSSIHASAILSATHVANVPQALWDRIRDAGDSQRTKCSALVSISTIRAALLP